MGICEQSTLLCEQKLLTSRQIFRYAVPARTVTKKHWFLYHTKENLAYFSEKKKGWWGIPSTWNFGSTGPRWSEIADFEQIIARSDSAVTPSEKSSINTNRKSTARFPISLRWSSYVAPKSLKGAQKRKTAVFPLKSHFACRKSATKFLCENCQRQTTLICRHWNVCDGQVLLTAMWNPKAHANS